jgi:hypothetical protein
MRLACAGLLSTEPRMFDLYFVALAVVVQTMVNDQPLHLIIQGQIFSGIDGNEVRIAVFFNSRCGNLRR